MEDNGRGVDPNPIDTPPAKSGSPGDKELTVMLIGSVGKMRSFKISRKVILYASIFFLIYFVISILIFYLYFELYTTHRVQSKNLQNLEAELHDKTKTLEQNKLYIKGLEDYRNTVQKELEDKGDTGTAREKSKDKGKPPAGKPVETEKLPETSEQTSGKPVETEKQPEASKQTAENSVEIRDIVFRRVDSDLILDFKLANRVADEGPAEGYIHIIVMDKNKECPEEWNYLHNKLSNCFPLDYRQGQQFLIQNFRSYQRQFKISPDSELPSFIRILVYDRSGQKILEKEFPVVDASANETS